MTNRKDLKPRLRSQVRSSWHSSRTPPRKRHDPETHGKHRVRARRPRDHRLSLPARARRKSRRNRPKGLWTDPPHQRSSRRRRPWLVHLKPPRQPASGTPALPFAAFSPEETEQGRVLRGRPSALACRSRFRQARPGHKPRLEAAQQNSVHHFPIIRQARTKPSQNYPQRPWEDTGWQFIQGPPDPSLTAMPRGTKPMIARV